MQKLRSILFMAWLYLGMSALALAGLPLAVFSTRAGLVATRLWAHWAVLGLRLIAGVRLRLEGIEHIPAEPVLFASKHQSNLETITAFLALRDPAIVLKRELIRLPLYGWYAKRTGMIVVDRDAHARALKDMVRDAKARFAEGRPVLIFPEGTRQLPGAPPDYKPGVAALYRELDVPCVPVALNTGLFWGSGGKLKQPGVAVIRFLPAIPPGLQRRPFMAELEARIEAASTELTGLSQDNVAAEA